MRGDCRRWIGLLLLVYPRQSTPGSGATMRDNRLYPIHVDECLRRIQEYVVAGKQAFMGSTLIQDAVFCNLQTLAESTQRLSDGLES